MIGLKRDFYVNSNTLSQLVMLKSAIFVFVEKAFRILSIALLTAVYCFALHIATKSSAYPDFTNKNNASTSEKLTLDFSIKLFCHTSQYESLVNTVNDLPGSNYKNPFTGFAAVIDITEQLFHAKFYQYASLFWETLINNRKSDIIFPFHYFW